MLFTAINWGKKRDQRVEPMFAPTADIGLRVRSLSAGVRECANETLVMRRSASGIYGLLATQEVVDYARTLKPYIEKIERCPLQYHLGYAYLYSGHKPKPDEKPERTDAVESYISAYISVVMTTSTFARQRTISYIETHLNSEFHNSFKALKRDVVMKLDYSRIAKVYGLDDQLQLGWDAVFDGAITRERVAVLTTRLYPTNPSQADAHAQALGEEEESTDADV